MDQECREPVIIETEVVSSVPGCRVFMVDVIDSGTEQSHLVENPGDIYYKVAAVLVYHNGTYRTYFLNLEYVLD